MRWVKLLGKRLDLLFMATSKFGVDFWDTYAPVVEYDVALTALGYFTIKGAKTHQVVYVTAILNGDMDEDIYITLPPDFDKRKTLCKLKKSLYGLKESPRNWYRKLCEILTDLGFAKL